MWPAYARQLPPATVLLLQVSEMRPREGLPRAQEPGPLTLNLNRPLGNLQVITNIAEECVLFLVRATWRASDLAKLRVL